MIIVILLSLGTLAWSSWVKQHRNPKGIIATTAKLTQVDDIALCPRNGAGTWKRNVH